MPTVQTVFAATVEIDAGGLFDEDGDNTGDNSGEEGSETEEPGGATQEIPGIPETQAVPATLI